MKKLLILVIIILLGILAYFILFEGLNVFGISILSIEGIGNESDTLDQKIQSAKELTSSQFPSKVKELETSIKTLTTEKEEYQDLVALSNSEELAQANHSQKYEIEVLWVIVGNHATKNGVTIKMDVKSASSGTSGLYDLNFTANGSYIGITDFLYAIEDDASLLFKIEQFALAPSGSSSGTEADTTSLQGTFVVKDLSINLNGANITTDTSTTNETVETNAENTEQTNETAVEKAFDVEPIT